MKKLSLIIGILLFSVSCDDLLEEDPRGLLTSANFWQTPEESEAGVKAIYSWVRTEWDFQLMAMMWLDRMAGDYEISGGNFQGRADFTNGTISPFTRAVGDLWIGLYRGVNMANAAITNLDGNEVLDGNFRDRLLGESKFMRSFLYFHLVQIFGEVPLILTETTGTSKLENPKAPIGNIYAAIEEDLLDAITLLEGKNSGPGRADLISAKALLAKVYLTWATNPLNENSKLSSSISLADEVINDGQTGLMENYSDIFGFENRNNQEILFGYNFDQANGYRNPLMIWQFPTELSNYVDQNGNKYLNGFGNNPLAVPLLNAFETNDSRLNMTWSKLVDGNDTIKFSATFNKKFYDFDAAGDYRNNNAPIPVIRLADIYLVKAEAEARLNGANGAAYDAINTVRSRAGLEDLTNGLSTEEFLRAVLHERRVEFFHEWSHRWFDLKRYGLLIETHREILPSSQAGAHMTVLPIPAFEIDVNSNIVQNPGY